MSSTETAVADLNGLLNILGVKTVDEALTKIEQLQETDKMVTWLAVADAELDRDWDKWRVGFGMYPMKNTHYQSQDDDWCITSYYKTPRQALMNAYHRAKKR